MKTRFLFLLPLAMLLWGCPGETDKGPEPEKTCLVREITYASSSKGLNKPLFTSRYTYDNQKQLTSVALDSAGSTYSTYTLRYNSEKQLIESTEDRTRIVNAYNAKGQLVKQTRGYVLQDNTFEERDYYTFDYNSQNNLEAARYFYTGSGTPSLFYTWKYTYTDGNPTTVEQLNVQGNRLVLAKLTYDTKKNSRPYTPVTFFVPLYDAKAAHNVLTYTHTDSHGGTNSYTSAYTYTEEGYASTATRTYGNGFQEYNTYTFDCQ